MTQPITHPLVVVAKKYMSVFNGMVGDLQLDRYQYTLVLIQQHEERLSQKALSDILRIDKSYMVTIIDYLSDKGYVKREKNPNDRREQLIKLTDKAREDLNHIKNVFDELNKKSLQNIKEEDIDTFNRVLKTIETNLNPGDRKNIKAEFKP
ncbi:MAG TPA: MarR family transcriptional regulator [Sphingobacteriaceae bacterium]